MLNKKTSRSNETVFQERYHFYGTSGKGHGVTCQGRSTYVVNLCYALAGVVAIVGAISVYIAMNNWVVLDYQECTEMY